MDEHYIPPRTDAFQQVIFTPSGAIDVIATDRAARIRKAHLVALGFSKGLAGVRRVTARALHALADRLAPQPVH